jgi:hypothetical protein
MPTSRPSVWTQPRCVETGLVQDPAADRDDQAGLFRQRDEVERGNLAEGRVLPAKKRFEPDHLERLELYDRLVGERELLLSSASRSSAIRLKRLSAASSRSSS